MKLQDVLLKAMAKKMRWWEAAEIIGVSDRTMRRWRERLEEHGYDGLTDRRKGKQSQRGVPVKRCEEVLRLYQERYFDLSAKHFHEKLKEEHSIELRSMNTRKHETAFVLGHRSLGRGMTHCGGLRACLSHLDRLSAVVVPRRFS